MEFIVRKTTGTAALATREPLGFLGLRLMRI
jgi:hypothetical protein